MAAINKLSLPAEHVQLVVAPSLLYTQLVATTIRPDVAVAGQNCCARGLGAYTGEVPAEQLANAGATWVLLGHSERRSLGHETDADVAEKAARAQAAGLGLVLCIGESREERERGETLAILFSQLQPLRQLKWGPRLVLAYEPLWAIGTGLSASPAEVQAVHSALRGWLRDEFSPQVAEETRIAYGGSIHASSAVELASLPDVDGMLVGGASLTHEFVDIVNRCIEALLGKQ